MAVEPGRYSLGPGAGAVHLRTTRGGIASMAGHDLLIGFASWSGELVVEADLPASRVGVQVATGSFEVLEGTGGAAAPQSADDRRVITATALRLLEVDRHPQATFTSTRVDASQETEGQLRGTLTVRGVPAPVTFDVVATGPRSWTATCTVQQSTFGIKPYRAFFGALRLADDVRVEVAVDLTGAGDTPGVGG